MNFDDLTEEEIEQMVQVWVNEEPPWLPFVIFAIIFLFLCFIFWILLYA